MLSNKFPCRLNLIEKMHDEGRTFRTFHEFEIPAGTEAIPGTADFCVEIGDNVLVLYARTIFTDKANIRYEVRSGAVVTNPGETALIYPGNPMAPRVSTSVFKDCVLSDPGTLVDVEPIPGQSGGTGQQGGQVYDPNDTKIIQNNSNLAVRLANPNNQVCKVTLLYKWFEVGKDTWADIAAEIAG